MDEAAGSTPAVDPPIHVIGWAKALALGVVTYIATSIALAFVGVPYFGLIGYVVGSVVTARVARAVTWRRWVAAFGLLFTLVVAIGVAAIGVLMAARGS